MVKRALDIIISSLMLIISSPLLIIIPILIKRDSEGPVIYFQVRVGKNGRLFRLYKFRTMVFEADRLVKSYTRVDMKNDSYQQKHDPRVTRIGRFLRRGFDELPELINVLKGDMSLVGPRPEVPEIVDLYTDREKLRLMLKPGITCLAIIKGRGDLTIQETLEWDLVYVQRHSFWLDIKILVLTLWVVLVTGRGAK